ncbi:MAG TPA: hypothetical protein VKD04_07820 [Burkholderiales bacterium]|nr:hypothetical protein [Burkholderiales bacterium]
MKKILITLSCLVFSAHAMAAGGLDGFLSKLNAQARSDLAGFSARISAQFGIPDAQVKVVISTVKQPADAFMVFQLGKMANQPTDRVMQVYQDGKGRGWGALAKDLGIKPGSAEFHALKRGDFRLDGAPGGDDPGSGKGKGKGKGKRQD